MRIQGFGLGLRREANEIEFLNCRGPVNKWSTEFNVRNIQRMRKVKAELLILI